MSTTDHFFQRCTANFPRRWNLTFSKALSGHRLSVAGSPHGTGVRTLNVQADPLLIRPPGALAEPEFLNRCVRCGQCMQVCITNGLQPVMLRAGIEGMFTPYLVARTGYCEFNCTLCGQVCPTGALQVLGMAEKHHFKIGHAWFDKIAVCHSPRGSRVSSVRSIARRRKKRSSSKTLRWSMIRAVGDRCANRSSMMHCASVVEFVKPNALCPGAVLSM